MFIWTLVDIESLSLDSNEYGFDIRNNDLPHRINVNNSQQKVQTLIIGDMIE